MAVIFSCGQPNNEIVGVGATHVTNGTTTEDLAIARYLAN